MDIQHLVDRLEELIDEGRHMPFSKFTLVDEERALEIIDQMRISIPEEIEKAARVLAQRDRILAQANEEAARLVQLARERGEQMLDREASVQAAQNRAANIVEAARQDAEGMTKDADQYVIDQLSSLDSQLTKMLAVIRKGISEVNNTVKPSSLHPQGTPVQASQFAPPQRSSVEVPLTTAAATTATDAEEEV
jgi:multidrug efflux pump subunit AcrA (membrane-fusion protein)